MSLADNSRTEWHSWCDSALSNVELAIAQEEAVSQLPCAFSLVLSFSPKLC
jgi:hypothetical protein